MSDFRTKLLGLAALGMAFAGLSYGQGSVACPALALTTTNPTIRAEGETELVSDLVTANCTVSVAQTAATIIATLSLPVTSKSLSGNQNAMSAVPAAVPFTGNSDAVLIVVTTAVNGVAGQTITQFIPGTVNGTSITFSLPCTVQTVPAGVVGNSGTQNNCLLVSANPTTLSIANVRVNAVGAATPQVTANLLIQYTNAGLTTSNLSTANPANVAYVLPSLSYNLPAGFIPFPYTVCAGNPVPAGGTGAPTAAVTLTVKQLFAGAWKLLSGAGGEEGTFPGAAYVVPILPAATAAATEPYLATSGTGTATQATNITVSVGNVPASATVYAPQSIASSTGGAETINLVGLPPVATSPSGLVPLNISGFTPTNGTVNLVYTPVAAGTGTNFTVPIYVIFGGNTAVVQSAITVAVTYTPAAAVSGPATLIPTFAVSTAAASNLEAIVACATTLLFPYVTNATGFETGIAIANTTTDNLGTIPGKPSASTPVSGTCTLNFYGNAAQPTATVTPTLGAYSAAAPTVVPIYANILTTLIGSSGFSGYAIANCNFAEAHGFAFITDTTGTFSGTEGYLAVVVPNGRGEAIPGPGATGSTSVQF